MRSRTAWAALAVVALGSAALAGCGADQDSLAPIETVDDGGLRGLTRTEPLEVGGVVLPDQTVGGTGADLVFVAQPDELLVSYFGYTSCPDVCPTTLADLRVAREMLGDDAGRVDLAMVTVDPERDTPEVLTGYLDFFADRFHAVRTTDGPRLDHAEQTFGASSSVTRAADGTVEVAHSGTTYVVGPDGTVLVEWPFGTSAQDMAHDLRLLLDRSAP